MKKLILLLGVLFLSTSLSHAQLGLKVGGDISLVNSVEYELFGLKGDADEPGIGFGAFVEAEVPIIGAARGFVRYTTIDKDANWLYYGVAAKVGVPLVPVVDLYGLVELGLSSYSGDAFDDDDVDYEGGFTYGVGAGAGFDVAMLHIYGEGRYVAAPLDTKTSGLTFSGTMTDFQIAVGVAYNIL